MQSCPFLMGIIYIVLGCLLGRLIFLGSRRKKASTSSYFVPSLLESAFEGNFQYTDETKNIYCFYTKNIGDLTVAEGKIIACDPLVFNNDVYPFSTVFPTGCFSVELAIARIKDDERVGFARIKFSEQLPVSWILAVCEGQDISTLTSKDIFGYGVDSGTGAFMDVSGGRELISFLDESENNYNVLVENLNENYKFTRNWLVWKRNGCDIAMFSSGFGDGLYASYIGRDAKGQICRLTTDFQLTD